MKTQTVFNSADLKNEVIKRLVEKNLSKGKCCPPPPCDVGQIGHQ